MKAKTVMVICCAFLSAAALTACNGSSHSQSSMAAPSPTAGTTMDTTQVLAMAKTTSETTDPLVMNATATTGAVNVIPANDETSDPAPVTGP